tara:strand:- start:1942 stop:2289 length:348 start_codon:yes stop_codon:yes gene_type:complete
MSSHVKQHVLSIIDTLENPPQLDDVEKYDLGYEEQDEVALSAYDYLTDALDIVYYVDANREYLGARILVAHGGPNIYVDTYKGVVEGHWWGDSYSESFTDALDLDEACDEMYNCN